MIDSMFETLTSAGALLLLATWRALPLLAIALAADLVLGRRLTARHHALLWTLVAARLLLPISIAAPLSLHGPIDRWVYGEPERKATELLVTSDRSFSIEAAYLHPANAPRAPHGFEIYEAPAAAGPDWGRMVFLGLLALPVLVAGALLLRAVAAHARFALRLKRCREVTEQNVIDRVLRECDSLRVRRRPRLKEVPWMATPAVFGLFRATICLPPGLLERLPPHEFRWVLRHELAHLRHRDAWILSLASVVWAIHWLNPCAWLVFAKLRSRTEQAADELALRGASPADAVAYGRLLLEFAEAGRLSRPISAIGLVPFVSERGLLRRVDRLTRPLPRPAPPLRCLIGIGLLLVAAAGLTDAMEAAAPERPESTVWLPRFEFQEPSVQETESVSSRSYDVAAVLAILQEQEGDADVEQWLCHFVHHFAARMPEIVEGQLTAEASQRQHRQLAEILKAMARSGPWQLENNLRVLQLQLPLAASIDWQVPAGAAPAQTAGSRPLLVAQVSRSELVELIRAIERDPRSHIAMAPQVTTFNGQTVSLADLATRPFVTGVVPVGERAWQPTVQTFDDGWKLTLRSAVTEAGTTELSIDLEYSEVAEVRLASLPFRAPDPAGRGASPMTVQVPTVRTDSLQMTTALAEDESLLIAVPPLFDPRGSEAMEASTASIVYVITPRKLPWR